MCSNSKAWLKIHMPYCMIIPQKNKFLEWPANICVFSQQRLKSVVKEPISFTYLDVSVDSADISKNEHRYNGLAECDGATIKPEDRLVSGDEMTIKSEQEFYGDVTLSDGGSKRLTSDEDVKLSDLKEDKVRRKKKKLKKRKEGKHKSKNATSGRKLSNLPRKMVKLFTMSEEQMNNIRRDDAGSEEFSSLKYKCDKCILAFNSEKLMMVHMNGRHKQKSIQCHECDVCQGYFLSKENLSSHRRLHLVAYKCRLCGLRTTLKRRILSHVRVHSDVKPYTCSVCLNSFSTKSKMAYHRSVCQQEPPQCDCCGKVFANKATLKYHLRVGPQKKEKAKSENVSISCKGCSKVFRSKKSYRAHAVIHNGLTYPCPVCGKLFQWKRNLSRHARVHRDRDVGTVHECRDCNRTFASRDCYNNHMRLSVRHAGDAATPHSCTYCGKKFPTKWCLVDHIDWDHFKLIKYQCKICFKAFKTAKILSAHTNNIHEGRKAMEPDGEHLCEICGKSYKSERRLKGHVWSMHTKRSTSKKYKCSVCPATFTWQTSIYKHMRMMHQTSKKAKNLGPLKPLESMQGLGVSRMHYFNHYTTEAMPVAQADAVVNDK